MNNEAAGQTAAEKTAHGLTRNLDAISAQEKPRYTELFESLRHAIRDKCELPDGTRSSWTRLNLPGPSTRIDQGRTRMLSISRNGGSLGYRERAGMG